MQKTVVINVVGLTARLLGRMPRLGAWAARGVRANVTPAFPAVTCTAQADYLTGVRADRHGIVGNGWYSRDDHEVRFWKQSNALVQAPNLWDVLRREAPGVTVANLFWWFNMYSSADYSVTPRPMYPADGRKVPDVHTRPGSLRDDLQSALGTFPLFEFWGPRASIRSSQWIADAARHVERRYHPALTLIYLPHLDYNLQRLGPSDAAIEPDLAAIDTIAADLVDLYERDGAAVIVLSEYGIVDVTTPVHLNRALRREGLISVRVEQGLDVLDAGASAAFAVADHQIAHVYVNDPAKLGRVRDLIEQQPGVERVLGAEEKAAFGLDHPRAGDLVAIARPDAWFTYYYWEDDRRAPDFARTVDIHRKPGYDPVELFLDPRIRLPAVAVGWRLAKRKLGFRTLLDVIPLDASLVRGSHGRPGPAGDDGPLVILSGASGASGGLSLASSSAMSSTGVFDVLANAVRGR